MCCKVNNLITDVGLNTIHFEVIQSTEFCKSHWKFAIFENDFGFDLMCVPAETWRMLSLETTNKRPIWLSLEQCQGLFLAFAHGHIVSAQHLRWFVKSCTCTHLPRLLYLLQQSSSSVELRIECSVVLGSLAMGTENNIKSLVDCQIIPALLQGFTVTHMPTHTHTHTYNLSCFCAHRSPVLRPGVHRSLPPMSENSFHQSSHTRAAAIYCRCSSCFTHNVGTDQFYT